MTEPLYRDDAYLRRCDAIVQAVVEAGIVTDRTVFYPLGGGQPGDTGTLSFSGGDAAVADTRYGDDGAIVHVLADDAARPAVGDSVELVIDWERRYRHMRMHTALHVLGSVLRFGVTGGNIGAERSRLDFDMEEPVDKDAVTAAMQAIVAADHGVGCRWITDAELDAQPELVRTMSVAPPRGAGRVRLLEIDGVDLQPCGGTHLKSTGEIGGVAVAKTEKKGKRNRRVYIELDS